MSQLGKARRLRSILVPYNPGLPGGSDPKEPATNMGDQASIPGLGRSFGEGNGNSLQCSCLENSMDRGAWWVAVHGATKSKTRLGNTNSSVYGHVLIKIKTKLKKENKVPSRFKMG